MHVCAPSLQTTRLQRSASSSLAPAVNVPLRASAASACSTSSGVQVVVQTSSIVSGDTRRYPTRAGKDGAGQFGARRRAATSSDLDPDPTEPEPEPDRCEWDSFGNRVTREGREGERTNGEGITEEGRNPNRNRNRPTRRRRTTNKRAARKLSGEEEEQTSSATKKLPHRRRTVLARAAEYSRRKRNQILVAENS